MISLEKAKAICKNEYSEFPIAEIIDIGGSWAFCFDSGDPPVPGIPIMTIRKENGEVEYMTIPPLENIEILDNGKVVE